MMARLKCYMDHLSYPHQQKNTKNVVIVGPPLIRACSLPLRLRYSLSDKVYMSMFYSLDANFSSWSLLLNRLDRAIDSISETDRFSRVKAQMN